jgi:hypothetical protein
MAPRIPFLLAQLLVPVHVFLVPASRLHGAAITPRVASVPQIARLRPLFACADADAAYRTLGVDEDASYDEIMDKFMELSERYAADPDQMKRVESAKEKVLDLRLRQRMEGSLKANYEGRTAREDIPVPPKPKPWEIANEYRKMLFARPSPKYALKVVGLLGGLGLSGWIAPSTAQTSLLLTTVSGMGFMYNRGEAEIPRDDFGQIGEIRPMKPKPMALTAAITAVFWFWGFFKAKSAIAMMASPPKGLEMILRCTFCSLALIPPALFVKVHTIFDR